MATAALTKQVVSRSAFLGATAARKDALKELLGLCKAKVSMDADLIHGQSRRWIGGEIRAGAGGRNGKYGGIGSGRKRRGTPRKDKMQAGTETTEPFLEPQIRKAKEEGHQVLADVEYLLLRATNPYGLVLEIAEEANEYLRNNKEDSLLRKPVLKMISDRINEDAGEQITDSYIDDHPDNEKYETL